MNTSQEKDYLNIKNREDELDGAMTSCKHENMCDQRYWVRVGVVVLMMRRGNLVDAVGLPCPDRPINFLMTEAC